MGSWSPGVTRFRSIAHGISTYDLGRLGLQSGEGHRAEFAVAVDPFEFGGEAYAVADGSVPARLDISRATHGHVLRLRFTALVDGPCMRCLETVDASIEIEAREVDDPSAGDEELRSPYVAADVVDLSAWAHDELALEIPIRFLCNAGEDGRCPQCGRQVDDAVATSEDPHPPDPRWAKLRELGQLE